MNRTPAHIVDAIRAAAPLHQKPDGTFRREGLQRLAALHNVSDRTVRRLVADLPPPSPQTEVVIDPEVIRRAHNERKCGSINQALLLSLTVGAGNMKVAHRYAQKTFKYNKCYRTFVRHVQRLDPALVSGARSGYKALVDNRIYLTNVIPHRNHTWYIDHTKADIWVLPDRGGRRFRPWLTSIVDGSTGMFMAIEAWEGHLNTERFTQALTRAAVGDASDRGAEPSVGGLPGVVVCDNAREHLAHAVEEGCVRLGLILSPSTPYHSWENGKVETAHDTIAASFLALLPGYTKGGSRSNGTPRFAPAYGEADDTDDTPETTGLLRMSQFQHLLEQYRVERNATSQDRDGLTPLDKWNADQTPLTHISPAVMLANLTTTARPHTVHKAGIRFRNRDYISVELAPYRKKEVTIRYLATVTDWIEVFDGEKYVGRAWLADHLSEAEKARILLQRGRVERQYRQVEHEARRRRTHFAHAVNEGWDPDDLPEPPSLLDTITEEETSIAAPLPVLRDTTNARRAATAADRTRDELADQLLSDGFTLEGDTQ